MPSMPSTTHPPALQTHTLRALDRLRSLAEQLASIRHARLECLLSDHVYPAIRDLSTFVVGLEPPALSPAALDTGSPLAGARQALTAVRADLEQALAAAEGFASFDPAALQHVLTSLLLPALAELEPDRQRTWLHIGPARIQELAVRDLLGPRVLLPLTDPPDITPALTPEDVDFRAFELYGRWFAAWRDPSSAGGDYELVLIEEDPRRPGSLTYTDC